VTAVVGCRDRRRFELEFRGDIGERGAAGECVVGLVADLVEAVAAF